MGDRHTTVQVHVVVIEEVVNQQPVAFKDLFTAGIDYILQQFDVALAEFLTELQLDKSKAPVIFDDPVTSLDHKIVDEVARRLVGLSIERQVNVFTHSILLFNSIKSGRKLLSK